MNKQGSGYMLIATVNNIQHYPFSLEVESSFRSNPSPMFSHACVFTVNLCVTSVRESVQITADKNEVLSRT